jgi:hypothetical protein
MAYFCYNNEKYKFLTHSMDTQTFITAVGELKGLTPEMVEHLTGLADTLTDEQRENAITELRDADEMIQKGKEEIEKVNEKGEEKLKQIEKEELPKLRKDAEDAEHSSDLGDAESKLNLS